LNYLLLLRVSRSELNQKNKEANQHMVV